MAAWFAEKKGMQRVFGGWTANEAVGIGKAGGMDGRMDGARPTLDGQVKL